MHYVLATLYSLLMPLLVLGLILYFTVYRKNGTKDTTHSQETVHIQKEPSLKKRIVKLEQDVEILYSIVGQPVKSASQGTQDTSDTTIKTQSVTSTANTPVSSKLLPHQHKPISVPATPQRIHLPPERPVQPSPQRKPLDPLAEIRNLQKWFAIIGIGLLLLGIGFLFKYSIDQNWITEPVIVSLGTALGVLLLMAGIRLNARRRYVGQTLLGGSIATFYITTFAACQVYELVEPIAGLIVMAGTSVYAFFLSLKYNQIALSLIGTIGALGTPFLLYAGGGDPGDTASGGISGLILYNCLALTGIGAIYLIKGWRSLLWTAVVGSWLVLIVGYIRSMPFDPQDNPDECLFMQLGIAFVWLFLWLIPVIREVFSEYNPSRWPRPSLEFLARDYHELHYLVTRHVHVLSFIIPLIGISLSLTIWDLSSSTWGWIAGGLAIIYGLVALALYNCKGVGNLAHTHAAVSLVLLTASLSLILEGNALFVTLVAEAIILHFIANRISDRSMEIYAHILFGGLAIWFIVHMFNEVGETPIANIQAITDISFILAALSITALVKSSTVRQVYRVGVYAAIALLLIRELNGDILFSVLTAEAFVLFLIGNRKSDQGAVISSHILFGILGWWFIAQLVDVASTDIAMLNTHALASLLFILAAMLVSVLQNSHVVRGIYQLCSHIAILGWFASELSRLDNGLGYITIAWGFYTAILLILGLRLNLPHFRMAAIATTFLVVGKLLLVDLVMLEPIWRVLLFAGFGVLCLLLSYWTQPIWRSTQPTEAVHIDPRYEGKKNICKRSPFDPTP
ncbi:MAG: DUF2339 domain-containing protein [Chloroflexota bacterium]|nr:DUF2339 domain-containing protein [Chloroflexota bacterium]